MTFEMVGPRGFEPLTFCTPSKRATRLRYGPKTAIGETHVRDGGDKGSRTPDLLNAIETLYQLSYIPVVKTADSIPNLGTGCKRDF